MKRKNKQWCIFLILIVVVIMCSKTAVFADSMPHNPVRTGDTNGDWSGSYVYFGELEGIPIRWRVLQVNSKELLLMSDKILDRRGFGSFKNCLCVWSDSDIRKYLNGEFMNKIFTTSEKKAIIKSKVSTAASVFENNGKYLSGGPDTVDYLYLPSREEIKSASLGFFSDKSRIALNQLGRKEEYWLRSPGIIRYGSFHYPLFCGEDGIVYLPGISRPINHMFGIRPMLKVSATSNEWNMTSNSFKLYNIKLNPNGGKLKGKSYQVEYKGKYGELPTPTKTNYTFAGWYTKKSGGKKITKDTIVDSKKPHVLYAHWNDKDYKIKYYLGSDVKAKNSKDNPKTYKSTTPTINLKAPTRPGYKFKGWYSDKYCNGFLVTCIKKGSKGNKNLYAKWERITYKITYYVGGKKYYKNNCTTYTIDTGNIKLKTPQKKGYYFVGWCTDSQCKRKIINNFSSSWAKNIVLYGKYVKLKKTTISVSSKKIVFGDSVALSVDTNSRGRKSFVSSDPGVLSVDKNTGVIKAKKVGIAKVSVFVEQYEMYEAATRTITIEIGKRKPKIIASDILKNTNSDLFQLECSNDAGIQMKFSINNSVIANIDNSGIITLTGKAGSVKITIQTEGTSNYNEATRIITLNVVEAYMQRMKPPVKSQPEYSWYNKAKSKLGYDLPNCTTYAYGRAMEILGKDIRENTFIKPGHSNARYWIENNAQSNNPYPVGKIPRKGAIAVWSGNEEHKEDLGHVAVVEDVLENGVVYYSHSSFGGFGWEVNKSNVREGSFSNRIFHYEPMYNKEGRQLWGGNLEFIGYIYLLDEYGRPY